jgi:hypothetical protein
MDTTGESARWVAQFVRKTTKPLSWRLRELCGRHFTLLSDESEVNVAMTYHAEIARIFEFCLYVETSSIRLCYTYTFFPPSTPGRFIDCFDCATTTVGYYPRTSAHYYCPSSPKQENRSPAQSRSTEIVDITQPTSPRTRPSHHATRGAITQIA